LNAFCAFVAIAVCLTATAAAPNTPRADAADAEGAQSSKGPQAFLGVRILKNPGAGKLEWSVQLPAGCPKCRLVINQYTSDQNSKDFYFHFWAPLSVDKIGEVHVTVDPAKVRGVLVGRAEVELAKHAFGREQQYGEGMARSAFRRVSDGIVFDVPLHPPGIKLPPWDAGDVTELYTFIETPGVIVRVGHADPARRRGPYASGAWPSVEAQAALNLEFATRKAVELLGLDRTLAMKGVAAITIMNFDTNVPTQGPFAAHLDAPPHWHMHLYWAQEPKTRKVGHFFIGPNGLLTWNYSDNLQDSPEGDAWYNGDEPDKTSSATGEVLYTQTITKEGFFELTTSTGSCRFTPAGAGFNSGVNLACAGHATVHGIHAADNLSQGLIDVYADGRRTARYGYDIDTGALRSNVQ
jgi:hypothetical protein